jgi:hypothetical protein
MVHFDADVVGTYLADKHRLLKTGDCVLFHHSNYTENSERSCGQNPHAHVYMRPAVSKYPTNGRETRDPQDRASDWGGMLALDRVTLLEKPEPHAGGSDSPAF